VNILCGIGFVSPLKKEIMRYFDLFIFLVLFFFLISCEKKDKKDGFNDLKEKIIFNYYKKDSLYYSPIENCLFIDYINNKFDIKNHLEFKVGGTSVKNFESPLHEYSFSILSNETGDYFLNTSFINVLINDRSDLFYKTDTSFRLKNNELVMIRLSELEHEIEGYLSNYIEMMDGDFNVFNHAEAILYYVLQKKEPHNPLLYSSFAKIVETENVQSVLMELVQKENLSPDEIEIAKKLHKESYYYLNKKSILLLYDDYSVRGLFVLSISNEDMFEVGVFFISGNELLFRIKNYFFSEKLPDCS
jgi:hypothetical protein